MYHWFKIYDSLESLKNNITIGKTAVFNFKSEKICIAHTTEGVFAVQDKCPHNGASLSTGFCTEENEIVCPIHRYKFNLKSGKATAGSGYALNTYPIEEKSNGVFVGIKAKWWEL